MSRLGRGRPALAVPILLSLAVLVVSVLAFNLTHLDTGGESVPQGAAAPRPGLELSIAIDPVIISALIVGVAGSLAFGLIYLILTSRRKRDRVSRSWWELLGLLGPPLIFLTFLYLWPTIGRAPGEVGTDPEGDPTGGVGNATAGGLFETTAPTSVLIALAVLALIFGMTSLLRMGLIRRPVRGPAASLPTELQQSAAAAVADTIAELELGGEVRTAILGCFQRFCRLLGAKGISDQDPLTSRELERLAVERLSVPMTAASTLTSLFEEARYSEHRLSESDRSRALESLRGIRAVLEG